MIKVIVAEDVNVLRKRMVKAIDSSDDIRVVGQAGTGREIVAVAQSVEFDIALLDIEMETMDSGITAAKKILLDKPDSKIIFLTLHESDDMIFNAIDGGAVDYIIKSEDVKPVLEHIRKVYYEKAEMDWRIQSKLQQEFRRLRKSENDLIFFIRNIVVLTPAEKNLLKLLVEGYSLKDIARIRYVELTTVKTQISHILKKLGVKRTKDIVNQIKEMRLESLLDPDLKV